MGQEDAKSDMIYFTTTGSTAILSNIIQRRSRLMSDFFVLIRSFFEVTGFVAKILPIKMLAVQLADGW